MHSFLLGFSHLVRHLSLRVTTGCWVLILTPTSVLFGNTPTNPTAGLIQGINSNHEQHAQCFCKEAIARCQQHHLVERLKVLLDKPCLSTTDIQELEELDAMLTKILVTADKHCHPLSMAQWSPTVQKAFIKHRYWSLRLAAHRMQWNLKSSLNSLAARMDPADVIKDPTKTLSSHLWQAQKQLKQARKDAAELHKQHLEVRLNQTKAANNQKKKKALTYLI